MHTIGFGRALFSLAMLGMGVLSLCFQDFASPWQPALTGLPFRSFFVCASGIFLLGTGIGLWLKRAAGPAALLLTAYWTMWTLIRMVQAAADPVHTYVWLGIFENLAIVSGALILYAMLAGDKFQIRFLADESGRRRARILFGAACLIFGLSHFVYPDATAGMTPAWLPYRLGLAYLTGAGHIAAGIAILFATFSRLGATLEASMMSLFVLLVHVPSIGAAPAWAATYQAQWTILMGALALAASAWSVADSFRGQTWGYAKTPPRPVPN